MTSPGPGAKAVLLSPASRDLRAQARVRLSSRGSYLCPCESCATASSLTPTPSVLSVPTEFLFASSDATQCRIHLEVFSDFAQGDISSLVSVVPGMPSVTAFISSMPSRVRMSVSLADYEPPADRTMLSAFFCLEPNRCLMDTCHMILSKPRSL